MCRLLGYDFLRKQEESNGLVNEKESLYIITKFNWCPSTIDKDSAQGRSTYGYWKIVIIQYICKNEKMKTRFLTHFTDDYSYKGRLVCVRSRSLWGERKHSEKGEGERRLWRSNSRYTDNTKSRLWGGPERERWERKRELYPSHAQTFFGVWLRYSTPLKLTLVIWTAKKKQRLLGVYSICSSSKLRLLGLCACFVISRVIELRATIVQSACIVRAGGHRIERWNILWNCTLVCVFSWVVV